MKTPKKGLSLALAAVMMMGMGTSAFAQSIPADAQQSAAHTSAYRQQLQWQQGRITNVTGSTFHIASDYNDLDLKRTAATMVLDGKTGKAVTGSLTIGDLVTVMYTPSTATATAVVTNMDDVLEGVRLVTVQNVLESGNGYKYVKTQEDETVVYEIHAAYPMSKYNSNQQMTLNDVRPGTKMFVWSKSVLVGKYGQHSPVKRVVFIP